MKARLISLDFHVPQCDTGLKAFPVVVGHDADAGIRLDDPSVAGCHCQIDVVDNHLTVRDLGTVHGTFVNGIRVTESILNPGDKLAIGMMTFLVGSVEEAETGPDSLKPTASGARYESAQLAPSGQLAH
jgi:pSer/pThr/pTyr-binding forkhead associated (FHA) protein